MERDLLMMRQEDGGGLTKYAEEETQTRKGHGFFVLVGFSD